MECNKKYCRFTAFCLIALLLFSALPCSAFAAEAEDILTALPDPVEWTDPNDPDNPYPYGLPVDTVFPAEVYETNPYAVSPMSQGSIPDEMWDNSILRALEYTGYDVQWLKDNNKLYNAQYIASSLKNNRPSVLSDIGYYSSGACPNGDETVADSSTVTGKAPNIRYFERNGLVCASFVTYYLCNYLPNIEGVDTSALYDKAKELGADPGDEDVYYLTTVTLWKKVLDSLSSQSGSGVTKYTNEKTAYQNLVPGDVIVFANDGKLIHIGIYAGQYDLYSNGSSRGIYHFLIHVGNSRGPEINTVEYMTSSGSKSSEPIAWYHLDFETTGVGDLEIVKRTLNPVSNETAPESGAVFRCYLKSAGSYDACPSDLKGTMTTGTDGKARSRELPYGTYVVEQVSGAEGTDLVDSFEVEVSENGKTYSYIKDNPYWTGTVSIVKHEEGTATPLVATFVLLDQNKAVLETVTTNDDGKASFSTKLVYGKTYYVQETVAPESYVLDETQHPITVTERDQEITLTLENVPEEGSISVRKVDTQGTPMEGVKFRLDYSTDGQNWKPVTKRVAGSPVILGGCTSAELEDGCLTTDASGLIVFTGLRISGQTGKVYYRLIECSTKDGSSMLVEPAYEGELPMEGSKDITVTVVNSQVFELPHTGSHGMITVPFGVMMLCIAGCTVFCFSPRYRKKED